MNVSGEAGIEALAKEPPIFGIGMGFSRICEMVGTG
jgi:anthranilate/para-aminobenzoate synthase component II